MKFYSLHLRYSFIICTICTLCFCCMASPEAKTVRVHARKPAIHRTSTPHVVQRKRLKLARYPTEAPIPTNYLSSSSSKIKRNDEIGTVQPTNEIVEGNIIEKTFSTGIKRLFKFLGLLSFESDSSMDGQQETKLKLSTFFPKLPFYKYDLSSLIRLIENMDDSQIEELAESAFVDTISQLIGIVGINDLRDWIGFILSAFILGPVLVPLFWLPVACYVMIGLLAPFFYYNPPSKLNTNVLGHDPIEPEDIKRDMEEHMETARNLESDHWNSSIPNLNQTAIQDSTLSIVETCMERISCQFRRASRENPVSNWLTDKLNATKVEWARMINSEPQMGWLQLREDCAKYRCSIFPPKVQRFFSFWTGWKFSR